MDDTRAARVIVLEPLPFVDQAVAGAVRRRRHRAPAGAAGERLGRAVIDGHYAALLSPVAAAAALLPFAEANGPRQRAAVVGSQRRQSPHT
jgi:hypothetical protein